MIRLPLVCLLVVAGSFAVCRAQDPKLLLSDDKSGAFVAFAPDGQTLATSKSPRAAGVSLLATSPAKELALFPREQGETIYVGAVFSHDAKRLAAVHEDMIFKVWDVKSKKRLAYAVNNVKAPLPTMTFSADDKELLILCEDWSVMRWDLAKDKELEPRKSEAIHKKMGTFTRGTITYAVTADLGKLAVGKRNAVVVFDLASGKELANLNVSAVHLALSPDGTLLALSKYAKGTPPGEVEIWDIAKNKRLGGFRGFPAPGHGQPIAFSPDGKLLAAAYVWQEDAKKRQGEVKLWDVAAGKERATLKVLPAQPTGNLRWLAFSPDGRTLAVASDFGGQGDGLTLWDIHPKGPR